jgi:hypothetical protein
MIVIPKGRGRDRMKITQGKALQLIHAGKGKIFYAKFLKKDNTIRGMTARLSVSKGVNGIGMRYNPVARGLLPVYDMDKDAWRMINLRTLQYLSIQHKKYEVY